MLLNGFESIINLSLVELDTNILNTKELHIFIIPCKSYFVGRSSVQNKNCIFSNEINSCSMVNIKLLRDRRLLNMFDIRAIHLHKIQQFVSLVLFGVNHEGTKRRTRFLILRNSGDSLAFREASHRLELFPWDINMTYSWRRVVVTILKVIGNPATAVH